jgi:hypothetical protein
MKPYKLIKVFKWNNENENTLYVFNDTYKEGIFINEIIYEDDNIEDALNKIALSIQNTEKKLLLPYYAWTNSKSLLFDIEKKYWKGYNINPLKSTDRKSSEINEPINYLYNTTELFDYNTINIIFNNDNDILKDNKYYFINKKIEQLDYYKKINKKMKLLQDLDIKNVELLSLNYNKYNLKGNINNSILLSEIFNNLKTDNLISLVQWINDFSKILYKLHKQHKISLEQLNNWTNIDKITKFNCVNIYSLLSNNAYCKITIDSEQNIVFSYSIDLRYNIIWDVLNKHKSLLIKKIETATKKSFKLIEYSINLNLYFSIDNSNTTLLIKKISEYIDIFEIIKVNKDIITCIYKRTSNYNKQSGFNIANYIKLRLELGLTENEILNELAELNIGKEDGIKLIKEQKDMLDFITDAKFFNKEEETFINIEKYKNGFLAHIYNIPNKKELDYLIFWLTRIISLSKSVKKIEIKKEIKKKEKTPSPSPSPPKSSSSEDLGRLDYDDIDLDDIRGGVGKKHNFIDLLRKSDKDLFVDNYARNKCQASQQPVVLSKKEYQNIVDNKNDFFDNKLEYGSSETVRNIYTCPRLWCPKSRIPLNPDEENPKCPIIDEEPIELFFDKDKNKKRYINLIKPNENGVCFPCCLKKPQKENELSKCKYFDLEKKEEDKPEKKPSSPEIKEENYLINQSAPVKIGRYGVIPKILHDLLFPKVNFVVCSKTLNKTKCFVRKGINHRNDDKKNKKYITNDSLINSISHGLNFDSKKKFIKDIKNKLDLITFLSLENGEICKTFMDELPLIPEDNILLQKEMIKNIEKFEITKKIFNLDNIKSYNLSRLLNIYKSYNKFIDYLSSDDFPINKSQYFFYSLLSIIYDTLLIIWEKVNEDIFISCPYYTCFEDIIASMNLNPNILMLLKDKKYYEPIELKIRGEDGEKLIKMNDYPNIKKLIKQCSILKKSFDKNDKIYNNIYSLNQWTKTKILKNSKKFIVDTIIINNDLSIDNLMTTGNILLKIEKISISFLPLLIKILNINKIVFYDDIIDKKFKIQVLISDLNLFSEKIKTLDIIFDIGKLDKKSDIEFYTILTISNKLLPNNIIHTRIKDDLYYSYKKINRNSELWFKTQLYVCNVIIKNFPENKKIKELMKLFEKNPNKDMIQIILEEIPLYSIKHVKNYMNDIIYYNKYYKKINNNIITEDNNEFIFSQNTLLNGIPNKLLLYHKSFPNTELVNYKTDDYLLIEDNEIEPVILPDIFMGFFEKLKSKWIMHKKSKWVNMVIIKNDKYDENTIPKFYNWLSDLLSIKTDYNDVKKISNIKLFEILENERGMKEILDDPSYFNAWNKEIKKKYKTIQQFYDNYYTISSPLEHKEYLRNIIKSDKLFPNDIHLLSISELLNVSILIIHRGKYGLSDNKMVRGDMDDLILSSTFFKSPDNIEERPIIIFSRTNDNFKSIYSLIIENTDNITQNSIYMKYKEAPLNIKYLIDKHIEIIN